MNSKDDSRQRDEVSQQEDSVFVDGLNESALECSETQNPGRSDVEDLKELFATSGYNLSDLPSRAMVSRISQDPERKIEALGFLDYLAEEPEKENIAIVPITLTAFGLAVGLAVDSFAESQLIVLGTAVFALGFVVASLITLNQAERKNREITKKAARAKSWATAIRDFRPDKAPTEGGDQREHGSNM